MYYVFAKIEDEYIFQMLEYKDGQKGDIDINGLPKMYRLYTIETWHDPHGDFLKLKGTGKSLNDLYQDVKSRASAEMVKRQFC